MKEYKEIFEAYKNVNEAQFSYAGHYSDSTEQPKKQLAAFKAPRRDKNSTAFTTASLPGGTRSVNLASMGTGGGIAENNEEVNVKGYGKMTRGDLNKLYDRVMKEVHMLKARNRINQLQSKLELLKTLAKHLT